jgi:hypothetical protein
MKYAISLALLILAAVAFDTSLARVRGDRVCVLNSASHEVHCRAWSPTVGYVLAGLGRRAGTHDQIILFQVKAGKPVARRIL